MNRGGHGGLRGKNSLTRLNQTSKFIQSRTHCHPRLTRNVKSLKPRLKWPEAWRSLSGTIHSPGVKHYGSADVRQGQLCGKRQPFPRWHRSQSLRRRDPPRATTDRSGRWTEAGQVLAGHAWTISRTGGGSYRFEVHRAQPGFPTGGPRHDGARDEGIVRRALSRRGLGQVRRALRHRRHQHSNPSGAPACCSSPEIVREIINGVQSAGVPAGNIVVYDRYEYEIDIGSYQALSPPGVRVVGIQDGLVDSGYDPEVYCQATFFGEWENRSYMARIVARGLTKLSTFRP